jgi:RNase H-like domain found in reverse transcriptase
LSYQEVILSVDSSNIAAGWLLSQNDETRKRHSIRYGSQVWKAHESRYLHAKLELFGLLTALKATRPYIVGVKNLIVEVDAEYIKGMVNNPDLNPSGTLNQWIATIRLFEFKL